MKTGSMKANFSRKMSKKRTCLTVKKRCKTFAESKLLSAVTVLQRDKKRHFSNFIYLIINNLIFKNWHWKGLALSASKKSAL